MLCNSQDVLQGSKDFSCVYVFLRGFGKWIFLPSLFDKLIILFISERKAPLPDIAMQDIDWDCQRLMLCNIYRNNNINDMSFFSDICSIFAYLIMLVTFKLFYPELFFQILYSLIERLTVLAH